jgi:HAD superfamily hydrolase (TIGR01549 family)
MAIKSIIFDLDGVILDSNQLLIDLHKKVAKNLGLRIPKDKEISSLWGRPWEEVIDILWPNCDFEKFRQTFLEIMKNENIIFPAFKSVPEVLKELNNRGTKFGIVTGAGKSYALSDLKKAGVNPGLFNFIITPEDTKNHKPHAEPILQACNRLGVNPEDVIYVGDSLIDYESAKKARVNFIGVLSGASNEEEFRISGVKHVINSIEDLPKFLKDFT